MQSNNQNVDLEAAINKKYSAKYQSLDLSTYKLIKIANQINGNSCSDLETGNKCSNSN